MRTLFLLLARYEAHAIPFDKFCKDFLGVCAKTGRNLRSLNRFPVPVDAHGMVDLRDAADYVDEARAAARSRKG